MRLLIIDSWTHCIDFAVRCQEAGHDVVYYMKPRKDGLPILAGDGLLDRKTTEFAELQAKWMDWADLILVPDNTAYVDFLAPYFDKGFPIVGPNKEAVKLELDREAGQASFRKSGLNIIESKTFHDYDAAAAYVEKRGVACVSKPNGDADKALTYVAPDAASMIYMLDRWKHNSKIKNDAKKHGFIIQDRIEGIEMGVAGWFGPAGWSQWFEENFEYKKLMDGDRGVNTGESGTLVRYVKQSKLAAKVLLPCTRILERIGYVGNASINCMIEPNGECRPMEWTLRFGWPAFHNQFSLTANDDPVEWMKDMLDGLDTLRAKKDGLLSVSVVYSIPPYPYTGKALDKETSGIPVYHATDREHIHPVEMMMMECPVQVEDKVLRLPNYATAGEYVLVATGTGDTISGARLSAYSALRKLKMPNDPQYRGDIGRGRLVKQLGELQKMGYAKGVIV